LRANEQLNQNRAVTALLGAGKDSMASDSAEYFLKLFLRSERIYQDLTLAEEQHSQQVFPFFLGFGFPFFTL